MSIVPCGPRYVNVQHVRSFVLAGDGSVELYYEPRNKLVVPAEDAEFLRDFIECTYGVRPPPEPAQPAGPVAEPVGEPQAGEPPPAPPDPAKHEPPPPAPPHPAKHEPPPPAPPHPAKHEPPPPPEEPPSPPNEPEKSDAPPPANEPPPNDIPEGPEADS